jgi:diguanylate cyclase (GGDEF)-like protein
VPPAPLPANEARRLTALQSYDVLDTVCDTALDEIAALAARLIGAPIALVTLLDGQRQWFKARVGLEAAETPRDQAFCGYAILGDQMLVVPDATNDRRFADNPLVTGAPDIRFYAGVPLINPQGFALGTLCVIDRAPRELTAEQRETLTSLARSVMTTLELHRAMKDMRALALSDTLTGLANRAALTDMAERAIARQRRHGEPFALLLVDLDGFKSLNDTCGHAAGDRALIEVARTLSVVARREDMAARIGGDEFALLLVACNAADLSTTADRIRVAVELSMRQRGWSVTASVGGVHFRQPPETVERALSLADVTMYVAKQTGRNRVATIGFPAPELAEAAD